MALASTSPSSRAAMALLFAAAAVVALIVVFGAAAYPWIKALHVIAIISWMAAMLYLPRIFVYHAETAAGSPQSETFKVMERRLLNLILRPAMGLSWLLGLWLAWQQGWYAAGWLQAKVVLVLALTGVAEFFSLSVRRFADDKNTLTSRQWRLWNEVPTVLMILIVVLAVVKPF